MAQEMNAEWQRKLNTETQQMLATQMIPEKCNPVGDIDYLTREAIRNGLVVDDRTIIEADINKSKGIMQEKGILAIYHEAIDPPELALHFLLNNHQGGLVAFITAIKFAAGQAYGQGLFTHEEVRILVEEIKSVVKINKISSENGKTTYAYTYEMPDAESQETLYSASLQITFDANSQIITYHSPKIVLGEMVKKTGLSEDELNKAMSGREKSYPIAEANKFDFNELSPIDKMNCILYHRDELSSIDRVNYILYHRESDKPFNEKNSAEKLKFFEEIFQEIKDSGTVDKASIEDIQSLKALYLEVAKADIENRDVKAEIAGRDGLIDFDPESSMFCETEERKEIEELQNRKFISVKTDGYNVECNDNTGERGFKEDLIRELGVNGRELKKDFNGNETAFQEYVKNVKQKYPLLSVFVSHYDQMYTYILTQPIRDFLLENCKDFWMVEEDNDFVKNVQANENSACLALEKDSLSFVLENKFFSVPGCIQGIVENGKKTMKFSNVVLQKLYNQEFGFTRDNIQNEEMLKNIIEEAKKSESPEYLFQWYKNQAKKFLDENFHQNVIQDKEIDYPELLKNFFLEVNQFLDNNEGMRKKFNSDPDFSKNIKLIRDIFLDEMLRPNQELESATAVFFVEEIKSEASENERKVINKNNQKALSAYKQIKDISIEQIVDYILEKPYVANVFFREKSEESVSLSGQDYRNFRKEVIKRPDLMEKLCLAAEKSTNAGFKSTIENMKTYEFNVLRTLLFSDPQNPDKPHDPFSLGTAFQVYNKIKDITIHRIVEFVLKHPNTAGIFFQKRHVGYATLAGRNFRAEAARNPELLKKLMEAAKASSDLEFKKNIMSLSESTHIEQKNLTSDILQLKEGIQPELNKVVEPRKKPPVIQGNGLAIKSLLINGDPRPKPKKPVSLLDSIRNGKSAAELWQDIKDYLMSLKLGREERAEKQKDYLIPLHQIQNEQLRHRLRGKIEGLVNAINPLSSPPDEEKIGKFVSDLNQKFNATGKLTKAEYMKVCEAHAEKDGFFTAMSNIAIPPQGFKREQEKLPDIGGDVVSEIKLLESFERSNPGFGGAAITTSP